MNVIGLSNRMKGIALAGAISGYILGPLILFGGGGWLLAERFQNRIYIICGVAIAFILTNVLIIRKTQQLISFMKKR